MVQLSSRSALAHLPLQLEQLRSLLLLVHVLNCCYQQLHAAYVTREPGLLQLPETHLQYVQQYSC